jgi:hypothetical protein
MHYVCTKVSCIWPLHECIQVAHWHSQACLLLTGLQFSHLTMMTNRKINCVLIADIRCIKIHACICFE